MGVECAISIYNNGLRRTFCLLGVGCDCLQEYLPSGQINSTAANGLDTGVVAVNAVWECVMNQMTLLEQLQEAAVDPNSDLGEILRRCKVLAARLKSPQLEDWLLWESNGYPDDVDLPDYRVWPVEVLGHFAGPFGSGIRNVTIPTICIPEEHREAATRFECRQSVATVSAMLEDLEGGSFHVEMGNLAVVLSDKVFHGQHCIQTWGKFGKSLVTEVLNSVRNRILDFVLAIWREYDTVGNMGNSPAIDPHKVTQIFNTTVLGGAANIVGTTRDSVVTQGLQSGDFDALSEALASYGVEAQDLAKLRKAIEADPTPNDARAFGPKVSEWIATMISKAASGSWKVGIGAGGSLLAGAIAKYYGL